jgi:cytochrome bd-type quinol oxidase subunit 2
MPLRRDLPIGLILLLALAGAAYLAMLANAARPMRGGEGAMADAFEALFVTLGLWIVLSLLVAAAGIMGAMPRWAGGLAVVLVPLSGVATVVAIDMCSRHKGWAIVFPAVLPLLIALYAVWARLPRLHRALPPGRTSLALWTAVLILSAAPLLLAIWI